MPRVAWNDSTAFTASCSAEKGQGGTSPRPLPHQAPIIGDKNHLLRNSERLRAERVWLWYALMVLWESPLG